MVLANALGFIFSLLETYLFIGVFYGWHEINRVLKVRILSNSRCTVQPVEIFLRESDSGNFDRNF